MATTSAPTAATAARCWPSRSCRWRAITLLPLARYYAYLQVAEEEQNLWQEYAQLQAAFAHFAMRKVAQASDIYPVFRELFRKEGVQT